MSLFSSLLDIMKDSYKAEGIRLKFEDKMFLWFKLIICAAFLRTRPRSVRVRSSGHLCWTPLIFGHTFNDVIIGLLEVNVLPQQGPSIRQVLKDDLADGQEFIFADILQLTPNVSKNSAFFSLNIRILMLNLIH